MSRGGTPVPPVEIADTVEEYARQWGRHAKLHFMPTLIDRRNGRTIRGTWVIRMTLMPGDPRLVLWQEQRSGEEPTEEIWLHVQNPRAGELIPGLYGMKEPQYLPIDILAWGPTNVRQYLEEGNMWSGRARASSPEEELKQHQEARRLADAHRHQTLREDAGKVARDWRRSKIDKIPFVRVLKDLTSKRRRKPAAAQE